MKANREIRRRARKLFRLCFVSGRLDAGRVHDVVRKILEGKHRGYIGLLWQFHRLVRLESTRHMAEVATAVPLDNDLRVHVVDELESLYGVGLEVRYVENPELIGGMRVSVGNDVYDDSVRNRLARLQRRFAGADVADR